MEYRTEKCGFRLLYCLVVYDMVQIEKIKVEMKEEVDDDEFNCTKI